MALRKNAKIKGVTVEINGDANGLGKAVPMLPGPFHGPRILGQDFVVDLFKIHVLSSHWA